MCRETEEFSDRLLSAKTEVASFEPFILQKLASFTPEKLSVSLLGLQVLRPAVAVLVPFDLFAQNQHSNSNNNNSTCTHTTYMYTNRPSMGQPWGLLLWGQGFQKTPPSWSGISAWLGPAVEL